MSDYSTTAELQEYLPAAKGAGVTTALGKIITRASRAIDAYTKREPDAFAPSPVSPTTRVIYGTGEASLHVGELVKGSVTTVTAPASFTAPTFRELPGLLHTANTSGVLTHHVHWLKGVPYVVTARWGYTETPADITEACLQLSTRWWRAKDEGFSGVIGNINRDGSISERDFPPAVKTLLAPYVLVEAEDDQSGLISSGRLLNDDYNPEGYR